VHQAYPGELSNCLLAETVVWDTTKGISPHGSKEDGISHGSHGLYGWRNSC
jgi:hypothetical protein